MLLVGDPKCKLEKAKRIPNIPRSDRGNIYEAECVCGGMIRASRSLHNGHLLAKCSKCGFVAME